MPLIEADLRSWSQEVLEIPSSHLGGLPPCPYAKRAWKENKVHVIESDNIYAASLSACMEFSQFGKELVVVASYDVPDIGRFHGYVVALNQAFDNLHCMEFHPDYGAEDAELDFLTDNDWESSIDEPYCMLFIQDLKEVVRASDKLERLGYYKAYPPDEYQSLVLNRKRRLDNGYETSCNEKTNGHEARWQDGS
jgi:hypothetical protein